LQYPVPTDKPITYHYSVTWKHEVHVEYPVPFDHVKSTVTNHVLNSVPSDGGDNVELKKSLKRII
jgi:hypothetical protein